MLGNCSPAIGISAESIQRIAERFGKALIHYPGPDKSHVFVTYENPEAATAALTCLNGQACPAAGNRVLVARYAEIRRQKVLKYILLRYINGAGWLLRRMGPQSVEAVYVGPVFVAAVLWCRMPATPRSPLSRHLRRAVFQGCSFTRSLFQKKRRLPYSP